MPLVATVYSSSAQSGRERGPELGAPLSDRLVADDQASLGEQVLNIAKADVETKYSQTA
jgi:hypothetical protein